MTSHIDLDAWTEHLGARTDKHAAEMLRQWQPTVAELDETIAALEGWLPWNEWTLGAELAAEAKTALRLIQHVGEGLAQVEGAFQNRDRGGQ